MPLVLDWTGLRGEWVVVLGDASPARADADDADAEAGALPSAEEPARLEQAWSNLTTKTSPMHAPWRQAQV